MSPGACFSRLRVLQALSALLLAATVSLLLGSGPVATAGGASRQRAGTHAALGVTTWSVEPTSHLVDGETVHVHISGGAYGTTYAVIDCGPKALLLLAQPGASYQDGCDSLHNTMVTVATNGSVTSSLAVPTILTTALGSADCRKVECVLAAVVSHSTGGVPLLAQPLHFSPNACAAPGACTTPADAWDPTLGPAPAAAAGKLAKAPEAPGGATGNSGPGGQSISPGAPISVLLQPTGAGDLAQPGSVTGPYSGQALELTGTATSQPAQPGAGEGLLRLALEAPGTSWGPGPPSSTVVDATTTDLSTKQTLSTQQFVLFWGSSPFVYAAFTGPVKSEDHYSVTLSVEPAAAAGGLSQPLPGASPRVLLLQSALEVVGPDNPQYLAYAYAPVMFGRSTSALHDVPLLTYATSSPAAKGATALSYVVVWSHEDAGTGFSPFLEWGTWGRMTDIEDVLSFTVAANGTVSGAKYLWGGEPAKGFPDSQSALKEKDEPFTGQWWGHHPVVRDATGNNDLSEYGVTKFRFQLAPVAAPPPRQARDDVMDMNPFSYTVMGDEVARWYRDISTNPASPQPGEAQQYAIVDISTTGEHVSSISVDLKLSGYPGWYRSDLGWGYPLVSTGHVRTVVKLPPRWASARISGIQVAVEPGSAAKTVKVNSLRVEAFNGSSVRSVPTPLATVVAEVLDVSPSQ